MRELPKIANTLYCLPEHFEAFATHVDELAESYAIEGGYRFGKVNVVAEIWCPTNRAYLIDADGNVFTIILESNHAS